MANRISVIAPSRIHFGLFGGKNRTGISYGGIGAMVSEPGLHLVLSESEEYEYVGKQSKRIQTFAETWMQFAERQSGKPFRIELVASPESHVGLGTGTQLGLSIAAALFQFYFDEVPSVERLSQSVQRGQRSAVGTYGFMHGGFIVDRGKSDGDKLAKIDMHLPIPTDWRFVLIKADANAGKSGLEEESVFQDTSSDKNQLRAELIELVNTTIVPSLLKEDFNLFSNSVYQFGRTSGQYFAAVQGGPFNGPRITEMVRLIREFGTAGAGQTSWGPTVYAILESQADANQLVEHLSQHLLPNETIQIAKPADDGAKVAIGSTAVKSKAKTF